MVLTVKHRSGDSDDRKILSYFPDFYYYTIFWTYRQFFSLLIPFFKAKIGIFEDNSLEIKTGLSSAKRTTDQLLSCLFGESNDEIDCLYTPLKIKIN